MFGFTVSNITCSKCSKQQSQLPTRKHYKHFIMYLLFIPVPEIQMFQKSDPRKKAECLSYLASNTPGQGGKQSKKTKNLWL